MLRLPTGLSWIIEHGGTVVVPTRQRAHAARLAHAAVQLEAGRRVWPTPDILPVEAWLTREVERHAAAAPAGGAMRAGDPASAGTAVPRLLSPAEEWFLWRQCTAEATGELNLVNRGALAESLRRASALASEFGIEFRHAVRSSVLGGGADADGAPGSETALLAEVQRAVDERCRALGAATVSSLVGLISQDATWPAEGVGPPHAAGFLMLPPRLRGLVDPDSARDLGDPLDSPEASLAVPRVVLATDELDELERIALWCKDLIARQPDVRILVMLSGAPGTRERLATLIRQAVRPNDWLNKPQDGLVVIEGGAPLGRVPSVAHALQTLSWLGGEPGDFEAVSTWLRAPYWQSPGPEARARLDLWLRERERMHFNLHELSVALGAAPQPLSSVAREVSAQINKATMVLGQGAASPREWSERFRAALEVFGWPGERARSSGEQQTVVRFHELLDEFGQLAAATRSISRDNAIQWFAELASRTAYRPADDDPVVTISSSLADPVVRYDAIWVAGLHAEAFPQSVQPDPFLPLAAQIAAQVPAASASGRLAEARASVASWRAATAELVLSAPSRSEDLELLPSPLLAALAESAPAGGASKSTWLPVRLHREGMLESLQDAVGPKWPVEKPLPSGTRSLELQNQCPFRAYAELRLGSTPLDAPEPGVAADLRGRLLHAALQKLWQLLVDSRGLAARSDAELDVLIDRSVEEAANETIRRAPGRGQRRPAPSNDPQGDLFARPEHSPAMSREIRRAKRLIRSLCRLERERSPFRVESTELDTTLNIVGAHMRIRIDRVDALETGGRAILDYKSGRRSTADWYGERPSHPQLLAYLAALGDDIVAMCTVNVTAREVRFDGIAQSAELLPKVKGVEGEFGADPADAWPSRRKQWLALVESLATRFLAGSAVVDPKPGACDYCHLASVCRIAERNEAGDGVESGHE